MQWTDEKMVAAMKSVEEGLSGVNQAALLHGVPKTSLKNRLSDRIVHGTKPGPDRNEEKELASKMFLSGLWENKERCFEHN